MFDRLLISCCVLAAVFVCGAHQTPDGASVGQNHRRTTGGASPVTTAFDDFADVPSGAITPSMGAPSATSAVTGVATNEGEEGHGYFLQRIFDKYGQGGVITLEGFEHLLKNLHLGELNFEPKHDVDSHFAVDGPKRTFVNLHDPTHDHPMPTVVVATVAATSSPVTTGVVPQLHQRLTTPTQSGAADKKEADQLLKSSARQSPQTKPSKCLKAGEILGKSLINPRSANINYDNFLKLCPIIVYELDQGHCVDAVISHDDHDHVDQEPTTSGEPTNYVIWFYSSVAVLIISITGMLSVAIVPIIQRFFYQQLLQFLVALAIGSLTGDALLHLLPHAMKEVGKYNSHQSHDSDGHQHGHGDSNAEIWLGLTALGGICLFFTAERALNALNSWKQKRATKNATKLRILSGSTELREIEPGYYYEGVTEGMLEGMKQNGGADEKDPSNCYQKPHEGDVELNSSGATERNLLNGTDTRVAFVGHKHKEDKHKGSYDDVRDELKAKQFDADFPDGMTIVVSEHKNHHHGHGHSHSHSHGVPRTAMATAWMVIAGDGLHNFSDGMAIGAAFANSLTGGLSTAIAVFCHELPHELGDFALLIKAGMGIRQALYYNGLSSLLCFLGMVVGLAMGNIQSANAWVFAGAAGMFLYIALVDMVPELNSATTDSDLVKFIIQASGIALGVTIMCLIALYEHDLQRLIGT